MMNVYKKNDYNPSRKSDYPSNKWVNSMISKAGNTCNKQSKANNENGGNDSNLTVVVGNWIGAIGNIISAIGSTPSTVLTDRTLEDFNLIGNVLEAVGGAIVAETEDTLFNKAGGQIAVIGNLTAVAGILSKNEQLSQRLEKQGELFQLVGAGTTIDTKGNLTVLESIANTAVIIQVIGIAIGVLADSESSEGKVMAAVGAWIEAVGAVISALVTTKMNF
ncbi:MAG TPA: hypothetical protein VNS08_11770 [Ureibacillus sp.]|nr:hypothetical protein [Ureibacillus sp.]